MAIVSFVNFTVIVSVSVNTAEAILSELNVKSAPPPEPVPLTSQVTLLQSKIDLTLESTAAILLKFAPVITSVPLPSSPIVNFAAVA